MLKKFDFYILREISSPFLIALLIYTFVLLMNQIFLFAELFITRGVEIKVAGELLVDLLPAILAFTIPMAVATGILAATSRLSSDWEILALKTLGLKLNRLVRPFFLFAFFCWLLTSLFTLYLAPRFNDRWVKLLTEAVVSRIQFQISPREFNESIPETMLYIEAIDENHFWVKVFVYQIKEGQLKLILAQKGKMNVFRESKKALLELWSGEIHLIPLQEPEMHRVAMFERHEEDIEVASIFPEFSRKKRVREKDIAELIRDSKLLSQEIESLALDKAAQEVLDAVKIEKEKKLRDWRSHQVEINKRFSLPLVCFLFALLGLPLGISTRRGGRTSGFTLSLVVILVYYVLITGGEKAAVEGRLPPWLGMWGPNLIFFAVSLFLFIKETKEEKFELKFLRHFSLIKKDREQGQLARKREFSSSPADYLKKRSLLFPSILDRYLIRRFVFIFFLVVFALLFIFIIVTIFERLDNLYEHNKPFYLLGQYVGYRLPEFLLYILPLASLTTTLLTLGLFEKTNEVTAIKASGISLYRLLSPIILIIIFICSFAFYIQEYIAPYANRKAEEVWDKINDVQSQTFSFLDRRWVLSREGHTVYHFNYFDPIAAVFYNLHLFRLNPESWQLIEISKAEKGSLLGEKLILLNGWQREFINQGASRFVMFKEMAIPSSERADYFTREWKEPTWMNWKELKQYIREVEKMGLDTRRLKVDLESKLSFPLVSLVMVLLGIPFAFTMGKRGVLVGLGISIVLAVLYWSVIG
ncbi:MAG: LptF/LptG family permease, partial [Candidatus Aminicenantes bacterium]|nr:LptF/LptG family permease [Candidatus Aminicenantes bacterium]